MHAYTDITAYTIHASSRRSTHEAHSSIHPSVHPSIHPSILTYIHTIYMLSCSFTYLPYTTLHCTALRCLPCTTVAYIMPACAVICKHAWSERAMMCMRMFVEILLWKYIRMCKCIYIYIHILIYLLIYLFIERGVRVCVCVHVRYAHICTNLAYVCTTVGATCCSYLMFAEIAIFPAKNRTHTHTRTYICVYTCICIFFYLCNYAFI